MEKFTKEKEIREHICNLIFPQLLKVEYKYRIYQEIKLEMLIKALEIENVLDNVNLKYTNVNRCIFLINRDAEDIEWELMKPLQGQSIETINKIHTLLLIH